MHCYSPAVFPLQFDEVLVAASHLIMNKTIKPQDNFLDGF